MIYLLIALSTTIVSFFCVLIIRNIALRFSIVDQPGLARKIHKKPIPLLGGVGIFFALLFVGGFYFYASRAPFPRITDAHVTVEQLFGILLAGIVLCIGGALDDRYEWKPAQLIIVPCLAVLITIAFGFGVKSVTNPFSHSLIILDQWNMLLFWWRGIPHFLSLPSDIITFVWLMGTMYTTKLLDGLDGLVASITIIGACIIGIVSLFFFVNQPTAVLSFMTAGAFAGFLILNFHPAKIFLGEAGSTLAGFLLGVLSIISGAKFAIALLVLGIPIMDTAWVIFRRIVIEHRSPFKSDKKHLHFRLLDAGFTQRQIVALYACVSLGFGIGGLFLQTTQKIAAFIILVGVMVSFVWLTRWMRRRQDVRAV